jgi:hypothetical protein
MPFTKTFAATVAQQDIEVGSYTKRVTLCEDAGAATTVYSIRRPNGSHMPVTMAAGVQYEVKGNFHPGQVLGTISVVIPATFQQDEE